MLSGRVQLREGLQVLVLGCLLALVVGTRVEAQAPLAVRPSMDGLRIGEQVALREDVRGTLRIEDMSDPAVQRSFVKSTSDAPNLGLSRSALWLRFAVQNAGERELPWLLELAYPHLDTVELYVPDEHGGFRVRKTGDARPFRERDLAYHNFVFKLAEPAHSGPRVYYLRVATSGALTVPLIAWTYDAFLQHQNVDLPLLYMFYGVILVMAVYNLFIFFAVRRLEYLYYVLYNLTLLVLEFTQAGHTFEYFCPNDPWLENHLMPTAMAVMFVWTSLFFRQYLSLDQTLPTFDRYYRVTAYGSIALPFYALWVPVSQSLRVVIVLALIHTIVSMVAAGVLVSRSYRPAKFYATAWLALLCSITCYLLKSLGLIGTSFVTEWGIQIGAALEVVLLSFALADRITVMRENLSELNAQLSHNVTELLGALTRAEDATRAKSEFLATMSHELRTPLNAIINIPQGLLADFKRCDAILCSGCDSLFEPEPGDPLVTAALACPHCQRVGALREQRITRYVGSPERTIAHLSMVERSGTHLLQMVNGVLDFSKIDASALKLRLDRVEVGHVLAEAVETMADLATRNGLTIQVELDPLLSRSELVADQLRVKQVLINLVGNAIKFSQGASERVVTVGAQPVDGAFRFFVRDRGIGIALEHQARIFERFEQVERGDTRRYGGTGLGLSISRSLIEMHEGRIWVESVPGEGSTFWFELPLHGPISGAAVLGALDAEPISEVLARVPTLEHVHIHTRPRNPHDERLRSLPRVSQTSKELGS